MLGATRARWVGILLAALPALSLADATVPDTPAGRAFSAWLDAINNPDRAHQQAFLDAHPSWMTVDALADWSAGTGGYELLEVRSNKPNNLFFHVKQRKWPVEEAGRLQVSAAGPQIELLGAWRMPPGAKFEPVTLDDASRAKVVERTAALLEEYHVDPAIGRKLAADLRKRAARGEYRGIAYADHLAKQLTADLRETGNDKHLEVRSSHFVLPAGLPAQNPEVEARQMAALNCGFEKAEHLRPNVGYLKFNFFADPKFCADTAAAAMTFLADSDALILDLRDNNGGRGGMAELIASYLFAERTHLIDNFRRADNVTTETWTLPYVPGKKFIGKPVFVLMSKRTFSAGEAFAFILKTQKRATLIGETTAGGSGTIEFKPIDAHFTVVVPTGRAFSPLGKADFAATGVVPDVMAPAGQALDAALKLAAP